MTRIDIPVHELVAPSVDLWEDGWMLLTAGDYAKKEFNCMTVSWGSLGVMWHRPFAQVVVRPSRHTFGFMERFPTFTLCAFERRHRPALNILGSRSGRDGDKIAATDITPEASRHVEAPCFREATLVVECRTMYRQDLDPAFFLDPSIEENYPDKSYHRSYFGEILGVHGAEGYLRG